MKCQNPEHCELVGCTGACKAPAPAKPPAPDEPKLGRFERLIVRAHDRMERLAAPRPPRTKTEPDLVPPPAAPETPAEMATLQLIEEMLVTDSAAPALTTPAPNSDEAARRIQAGGPFAQPTPAAWPGAAPAPKRATREIKIVSTPFGGYGIIEGNALIATAGDNPDEAGRILALVLRG